MTGTSNSIELILLDWTMPGLSGAEALASLREAAGQWPIVVCSGANVNLDETQIKVKVLRKPYRASELIDMVRETIGVPASD